MNRIVNKIRNLCFMTLLVLVVILLSTFGWMPLNEHEKDISVAEIATSKRIKEITTFLAVEIGTRNYQNYDNLEMSVSFIIKSFEELGYTIEIMSYEANGQVFKNVIAYSPENDPTKNTILIGAHYDSCFNPGADDNATGVAGMIELARLFKDEKLNHNLRFVGFVNEEPPFFNSKSMGSMVYANEIKSSGDKIKVAVILETIGYYSEKPFSQKYLPLLGPFYPNKGNFIAIVGNFNSKNIVNTLYTSFKNNKKFPAERVVSPESIPGINFSDHWSFWKVGIPAVMITDTAYLRNSNYHKKTDLPATLNFEKMAKMIFGLRDSIIALDKDESN